MKKPRLTNMSLERVGGMLACQAVEIFLKTLLAYRHAPLNTNAPGNEDPSRFLHVVFLFLWERIPGPEVK